jgi:hypothetical protein
MEAATKTIIWDFWKSNKSFWIPVTVEEKDIADKTIFATFYNYSNLFDENPIGQIIYLDQFYRHFQRILPDGTITEKEIYQNRQQAVEILQRSWTTLRLTEEDRPPEEAALRLASGQREDPQQVEEVFDINAID